MHRGEVLRSVVDPVSDARGAGCRPHVPGRRAGRPDRHVRHLQPRRRHLGGREQRLGGRRRHRVRRHRRRPRRPADPASRRPRRRVLAILLHPRPRRPHHRRRPRSPTRPARRSYLHPADRVLWDAALSRSPPTASSPTATSSRSATSSCTCCTPPATPAVPAASTRPALGAVFTGDTLFQGGPGATGRSFSDFPTIVESIRDRLLDAAARDGGAHRPRRRHHDRRRGAAPAGVDRPRPLSGRSRAHGRLGLRARPAAAGRQGPAAVAATWRGWQWRAGNLGRVSLRLQTPPRAPCATSTRSSPARRASTSAGSPRRARRTSATSGSPSRSTCCAAG